MTLQQASEQLCAALCPSGVSVRPPWLCAIGINEKSGRIVVYVRNMRQARLALASIAAATEFDGFTVEVKRGDMRIAAENEPAT